MADEKILDWANVAPTKESALRLVDLDGKTVVFHTVGVDGDELYFAMLSFDGNRPQRVLMPRILAGKIAQVLKDNPGATVKATVKRGARKVTLV